MIATVDVMRRKRKQPRPLFLGVRIGRRGRLSVFRNGVPVRELDRILAMTGRKV
jgi:hypothetical protein